MPRLLDPQPARRAYMLRARPFLFCFGLAAGLAAQSQNPALQAPATVRQARSLLDARNYQGAEKLLRELLTHTPDSADGHFLLGFALLHEVKPADSLAEYTRGAALRKPGPEELTAVASDYVLLSDYADAEHWLRLAAGLDPKRAHTWYMLGRTQYNENHWRDAESSFLTCLRLDPRNVKAEYNLGLVYEGMERPDDAIAAYRTAIAWLQDAPDAPGKDLQPYLDLGMLLRHQDKAREALPLLLTATPRDSRNPLAHQELGLDYEQLGEYDQAVTELQTAISLSPSVGALHFFLGRIYRKGGHPQQAAAEFAQASKLAGTKTAAQVPNQDLPDFPGPGGPE